MEYKIKYHWEVDVREMVISYLSFYYKRNPYVLLEKENVDENMKSVLIKIYKIIDHNIDKTTDTHERFFKPLLKEDENNDITLAQMALIESSEFNSVRHSLSHFWDQDFEENQDLINFVNKEDLDFELKFNVLNVLQNHESLLEEVLVCVSDVLEYEDELLSLCDEAIDIMKGTLNDDYVAAIFEYLKIDLAGWKDIDIYPDMVRYSSLQIIAREEKTMIRWGAFAVRSFENEVTMSEREENFLDVSKMLSDPTKLEIVKYCLDKERYATEIAEHLSLSGATVSHHMNILTSNNYMTIRLDKKRIYYKTNVKKILNHISYINDLLAE